jgi:hypothetical protein
MLAAVEGARRGQHHGDASNETLARFADSLLSPNGLSPNGTGKYLPIAPSTAGGNGNIAPSKQQILSTMQQHFYQNPNQMVNLPADDFASLASYFNLPSPPALPNFSPMLSGGLQQQQQQQQMQQMLGAMSSAARRPAAFNFDNVPKKQKRINPALQKVLAQSSNCPACRGKHRAHTCGRGSGSGFRCSRPNTKNKQKTHQKSVSSVINKKKKKTKTKLGKRKKPPPPIGTNLKTSTKQRKKNFPSINVEQINQESPGSTRTMGEIVTIGNF